MIEMGKKCFDHFYVPSFLRGVITVFLHYDSSSTDRMTTEMTKHYDMGAEYVE